MTMRGAKYSAASAIVALLFLGSGCSDNISKHIPAVKQDMTRYLDATGFRPASELSVVAKSSHYSIVAKFTGFDSEKATAEFKKNAISLGYSHQPNGRPTVMCHPGSVARFMLIEQIKSGGVAVGFFVTGDLSDRSMCSVS